MCNCFTKEDDSMLKSFKNKRGVFLKLLGSITLERATLKRGLEVAGRMTGVRLVKDRIINLFVSNKGHFFVFTNEGEVPYVFFHKQESVEHSQKEISLQVNPKEIVDAFKGSKGPNITLDIFSSESEGKVSLNKVDVKATILKERNFEGKRRDFTLAENEEEKVKLLKELGEAINEDTESVEVGGRFLKLKSPNFLKSSSLDVDLERVVIDPSGFATMTKQLTWQKSSENLLFFFSDGKELGIRASYSYEADAKNHEQLFLFKPIRNDAQMIKEYNSSSVYSFEIDATEMNNLLKEYKKEHKNFFLSGKNGYLEIDPYGTKEAMEEMKKKQTEDFFKKESKKKNPEKHYNWKSEKKNISIKTIDYKKGSPYLATTKISSETLKVLFKGYKGNIIVEILEFEYDNREFYKFRCSKGGLDSIGMIIKEPNYKRIQKELEDIIEFQKKLTYI